MTLRQAKPRPRTEVVAPRYPRALGLLALGLLTACAATVQVEGETTSSTDTGAGASGPAGGIAEPFGGSGGSGATAG
ncbi:MAG: hypothetical protein IT373_36735, partial [Polyangiaceae bacterium]|nr:hypothetical protein [Polyangiaceae bacterium]